MTEKHHNREAYEKYAGSVAYVEIRRPDATVGIGTAFHIGDGVFVTARHVVENVQITKIGTTEESTLDGLTISSRPAVGTLVDGPFFHPDPKVDLAVIRVAGIEAPAIPIACYEPRQTPVLTHVLVMGYPPIPLSREPVLVAISGEVCAVVNNYQSDQPHLILSTMARGGLSGGIAFARDAYEEEGTLGLITECLVADDKPAELGYLALLPIVTVYGCAGQFESKLDWFLSPGRQEWAERVIRGQEDPDVPLPEA